MKGIVLHAPSGQNLKKKKTLLQCQGFTRTVQSAGDKGAGWRYAGHHEIL